jgi:hypothetical protein
MTIARKYDDQTIVEILKLFIKGYTREEITKELKITRWTFRESLLNARKQYQFKTNYELLADYVKHQWWPGEAEKSGTWNVLNDAGRKAFEDGPVIL